MCPSRSGSTRFVEPLPERGARASEGSRTDPARVWRLPDGYLARRLDLSSELGAVHELELSSSWGFADHLSDVSLLERFGHPVVVDPAPALREVARSRGWEILMCGSTPGGPAGRDAVG